MTASWG